MSVSFSTTPLRIPLWEATSLAQSYFHWSEDRWVYDVLSMWLTRTLYGTSFSHCKRDSGSEHRSKSLTHIIYFGYLSRLPLYRLSLGSSRNFCSLVLLHFTFRTSGPMRYFSDPPLNALTVYTSSTSLFEHPRTFILAVSINFLHIWCPCFALQLDTSSNLAVRTYLSSNHCLLQ